MKQLFYNFSIYRISIQARLLLFFKKQQYKNWFNKQRHFFEGKNGFEVGGPSSLFAKELMPIYTLANTIDGCNYSNNTLWEGHISSEDYKYFEGKRGIQYILEGTDLSHIESNKYDFVLSCHNLEHIANPLKALKEWIRILKHDGTIVLILPDKRFTFDRKRPYTVFEHIVADFENNVQEDDLTHLSEILALHDLRLDPLAGSNFEHFRERSKKNFDNRGLHHHVYNSDLLKSIFTFLKVKTISQQFLPPFHQIIIGKKTL